MIKIIIKKLDKNYNRNNYIQVINEKYNNI